MNGQFRSRILSARTLVLPCGRNLRRNFSIVAWFYACEYSFPFFRQSPVQNMVVGGSYLFSYHSIFLYSKSWKGSYMKQYFTALWNQHLQTSDRKKRNKKTSCIKITWLGMIFRHNTLYRTGKILCNFYIDAGWLA